MKEDNQNNQSDPFNDDHTKTDLWSNPNKISRPSDTSPQYSQKLQNTWQDYTDFTQKMKSCYLFILSYFINN
jgi:hypothetical protein